ncbi:MAG: carboxypeptidase-like regulatory domain-containing protein [marine benthic group bacterium]|nr:carboxypeptidase-like regulatory domain-containing protein [Gemmatimonadota bacterium]MCL7964940.1 carboxypeptidase-like regulatory domain-containing protein [Gemmatimonadota bacterium]MCL7967413.1 carboxypeptidase-like regulatory domain-containing protein [Gemmatimonadota bacterium]MCL7978909.1 carboxypeptidase-like regulatory domain-containing protein [Gemmatimonadota bacterium]
MIGVGPLVRGGLLTAASIAVCLSVRPAPATAQAISGIVEDSSGAPISGAFVVLEDSSGAVVARTLTRDGGGYRLAAPVAGRFRLRTDRIGYVGAVSPWLRLEADETLEHRFRVEPVPIRLQRITVSERARCELLPDEGVQLQSVWDEARKALTATSWTGQQPYFRFDAVMHSHALDARGRPLSEAVLEEVRFYGRHPFRSIPARDLVFGGFVQEPEGRVAYYAPDADVLLSETFVRRHCFRLVRGGADRAGLLGLEFEALPQSRLPDIEGIMWLDPATSELRRLDYSYVNLDVPVDTDRLGGQVEFARLPTGAWIIRGWKIRVPVIEWVEGRPGRTAGRYRLTGINEGGGQVLAVWMTARIAGLLPTDTLRVTPPPDSLLVRFELREP